VRLYNKAAEAAESEPESEPELEAEPAPGFDHDILQETEHEVEQHPDEWLRRTLVQCNTLLQNRVMDDR
jgi:hypothetical protein